MAEIKKLEAVVGKFRKLAAQSRHEDDVSVVVGYTQRYAIYVHENREAHHPVGRAGFLLDVAREMQKELSAVIFKAKAKGKRMGECLLLAGLRLQRESQLNCPVDTGALKNSAFTRVE